MEMKSPTLRAPFPWFGGKSKVAAQVWERFGDTPNYVEPFAGSLAVLLGRETAPRVETVNDIDCVAPETRMLTPDLRWVLAGSVKKGDRLLGFDESNGEAREGLRAPKKYRRFANTTVTGVRRLTKPCYRLTFNDGTSVVCSDDHLWLGGSHLSGGRGWRWIKTKNMVCNRRTQRSWVLKVADVVEREETHDAGWLGGILDGEGNINAGPGMRVVISQKPGPVFDRAERLLNQRGFKTHHARSESRTAHQVQVKGGMVETLSLLMCFRPERLIANLTKRYHTVSLYGRSHRAIGLVSKEFLGEQTVIAIQTNSHTFIAEGIASHNCWISNFWRALQSDPEGVATAADWPVNEADLHARHLWLVNQLEFREKMKTDPDYYDAKIAGWWCWGICQWIGSGWCAEPNWRGRTNAGRQARGLLAVPDKRPTLASGRGKGMGVTRKIPYAGRDERGLMSRTAAKRPRLGRGQGRGVSRQLPQLSGDSGAAGRGIHSLANTGVENWLQSLAERLRRVRVCCGDWSRVVGPSVTSVIGLTGVFLDPPYDMRVVSGKKLTGRDGAAPTDKLYENHDNEISAAVRTWAIENGDNPLLRIAVCGYSGEHEFPDTWEVVKWKANGGFGNQNQNTNGAANAHRERIWFSPHCRRPSDGLFYSLERNS